MVTNIDDMDLDLGDDSEIFTDLDDFLETSLKRSEVLGSWGFNTQIDFTKMSREENNVWFFEQVFNFLRSFFGVIVPDQVEIITYNATQQINRDNLDQMTFLDELMLILKNLTERIWVLKLSLSIVGFLKSEWDPDRPLRLRIQEPCNFIIWGGPDETGFQSYSISYKLFSSQVIESEGVALWSMNQPLLEKALKKWEIQSKHKIDVVQGNDENLDLYKYGFKSPAPKDVEPIDEGPPPDDEVPDLGDLNI